MVEKEIAYIYKSKSQFPLLTPFIVILIGDVSVGKTCLLTRYVKDTVSKHQTPTIGVEFATTNVTMRDGATVKAQLWDTAGQEKYRSIVMAHYRKAAGALVVYDITNR
jgi:small GTP-binding protein